MVLTLLELLENTNSEKLCYYLSAQYWAFSSGKSTLAWPAELGQGHINCYSK